MPGALVGHRGQTGSRSVEQVLANASRERRNAANQLPLFGPLANLTMAHSSLTAQGGEVAIVTAEFPKQRPGVNYLTEGGQETEIMYKYGFELPHFAFPR